MYVVLAGPLAIILTVQTLSGLHTAICKIMMVLTTRWFCLCFRKTGMVNNAKKEKNE